MTPSFNPPPTVLTRTQAIVIALSTVRRTVKALHVFGIVALQTARSAGVIQHQVVRLAAQTVRVVPPAGCALWDARLAHASQRKPSRKEAGNSKICVDGAGLYAGRGVGGWGSTFCTLPRTLPFASAVHCDSAGTAGRPGT